MPETRTTEALPPNEAPRSRPKRVERFGDRLKREREMRGVPLEEIAEATKIGTRSLRALEEERFDQLPGGIFNKGFVRAYARFLGIDEEQAVADYLEAHEEQQKIDEPAHLEEIARQVQAQRAQMHEQNNLITWLAVILIGSVVALGAFGWRSWQKEKTSHETATQHQLEQQQAASAQPQTAAPANQGVPAATENTLPPASSVPDTSTNSAATAETTKPVAEPPKQASPTAANADTATDTTAAVNLTLKAVARTWISVTVDGGKTTTMTLDPNDPKMQTRTFHGAERVFLIVGNPAGLEASFNGKPVGTLGPEGQRRQVMFTPTGKQ